MPQKLVAFPKSELPQKLADYVIKLQDKAIEARGAFHVAISGGSLAKTMSAGMLKNPGIKWNKWVIWLADERIVPIESEDSNYGIFLREVIQKLPSDQRPKGEPIRTDLPFDTTPIEVFAEDYQSRLVKALGDKPAIDFILLGAGPDAHTCSLFPGHKLLEERKLLVAGIEDSPKPPPRRITLTKPTLSYADEMAFVCTGASKQDAIKGVFVKHDKALPSFQVDEEAKNTVLWFCDEDAVATSKTAVEKL